MKQQINDLIPDELDFPECAFRFVYLQAVDPDYAENLVEELKDE